MEGERGERKKKQKGEEALNVELPAPCNLLREREGGGVRGRGIPSREGAAERAEAIHSDTHTHTHTHWHANTHEQF